MGLSLLTTGDLEPWHPNAVRSGAGLHYATAVTFVMTAVLIVYMLLQPVFGVFSDRPQEQYDPVHGAWVDRRRATPVRPR